MPYTIDDAGKTCPYCKEGIIVRYRSGKLGCNKFCWKNKPQVSERPRGFQKAIPSTSDEILKGLRIIYKQLEEIRAWMKEIESRSVIYPSREDINTSRYEEPPTSPPELGKDEEETEEEL